MHYNNGEDTSRLEVKQVIDIKKLRESKEMTQNEFARLIGVDRSAVAKWETGKARPSVETAKRIAAVLEFEWTRFFEEDTQAGER